MRDSVAQRLLCADHMSGAVHDWPRNGGPAARLEVEICRTMVVPVSGGAQVPSSENRSHVSQGRGSRRRVATARAQWMLPCG